MGKRRPDDQHGRSNAAFTKTWTSTSSTTSTCWFIPNGARQWEFFPTSRVCADDSGPLRSWTRRQTLHYGAFNPRAARTSTTNGRCTTSPTPLLGICSGAWNATTTTRECADFEDAKAWGGSAWSGLRHSSGTTKGDNGGETHYNYAELFVYDNAGACSELFAKGIYNYDQDGRQEANRGGPHG